MNDSKVIGIPVWLGAIIGAYAISPELGAAATVGYVAQWTLKAPARIYDWVAPVVILGVCAMLYLFVLGHMPPAWPPTREWFSQFIVWVAAAIGTASASGRTAGAPKTNSI